VDHYRRSEGEGEGAAAGLLASGGGWFLVFSDGGLMAGGLAFLKKG
jgi:hypothetical protein